MNIHHNHHPWCSILKHESLTYRHNVRLEIQNRLSTMEKLRLELRLGTPDALGLSQGVTDSFLVTGPTCQGVVLAPKSTTTVSYVLLPLACGHCSVPRITATWVGSSSAIGTIAATEGSKGRREVVVVDLQKEVFVLPSDTADGACVQ